MPITQDFNAEADTPEKPSKGALLKAVQCPKEEVDLALLQSLLDAGADINEKDEGGTTPLLEAIAREMLGDVVPFLVARGAALDEQNNVGFTALHIAAKAGFADAARLLIDNGADTTITCQHNGQQVNAADLAEISLRTETVAAIEYALGERRQRAAEHQAYIGMRSTAQTRQAALKARAPKLRPT